MPDHDDTATRVLVYGSCVARDTIEFADPATVELRGYVARQSLLSAGSDASSHLPDDLGVSSRFQERMIVADFTGALFERIVHDADSIDLLLWDLADERHGAHRFVDGTMATRSIDTMRAERIAERLDDAELIPFGSDEHFTLWTDRLDAFEGLLRDHSLLDRTVVLEIPWAVTTTEGKPSPWSMGVRAKDANERYRRYYDVLRSRGHRMVTVTDEFVLADPEHRWGLAPFHYAPAVYREILRQLREQHGVDGIRPAEA